jgi:hypothetical protein
MHQHMLQQLVFVQHFYAAVQNLLGYSMHMCISTSSGSHMPRVVLLLAALPHDAAFWWTPACFTRGAR